VAYGLPNHSACDSLPVLSSHMDACVPIFDDQLEAERDRLATELAQPALPGGPSVRRSEMTTGEHNFHATVLEMPSGPHPPPTPIFARQTPRSY
jgi:hypothetical protein